jgi:hypothetical protein
VSRDNGGVHDHTSLYARISTAEQETAHKLARVRAAGFDVDADHVVADHGVSPGCAAPTRCWKCGSFDRKPCWAAAPLTFDRRR